MKPLCIVDTCSLIYLSEITVANRSLHRWLWDEFKVVYSAAVWDETQHHLASMGRDRKRIKRVGEKSVWLLSTIVACERALFGQSFEREEETGFCRQCRRPFFERRPFDPDLGTEKDRGERHNCCVALDAILTKDYQQIIFLTDDYLAVRDYVAPVFKVFPLGSIWSSHDLVVYLFMRHRKHIPQDAAKNAIRDVVAKATEELRKQPEETTHKAKSKWMGKLVTYHHKVERVDQVLSRFRGGR